MDPVWLVYRQLAGLKLLPIACRCRFHHGIVIFDIVTFQQEFITYPLWDYMSRKINKVDQWRPVWNPYCFWAGRVGNRYLFKFAGIDWYLVYKILNNSLKDENALWKLFSRMDLVVWDKSIFWSSILLL